MGRVQLGTALRPRKLTSNSAFCNFSAPLAAPLHKRGQSISARTSHANGNVLSLYEGSFSRHQTQRQTEER